MNSPVFRRGFWIKFRIFDEIQKVVVFRVPQICYRRKKKNNYVTYYNCIASNPIFKLFTAYSIRSFFQISFSVWIEIQSFWIFLIRNEENPDLLSSQIAGFRRHPISRYLTVHSKKNQEVFSSNFIWIFFCLKNYSHDWCGNTKNIHSGLAANFDSRIIPYASVISIWQPIGLDITYQNF